MNVEAIRAILFVVCWALASTAHAQLVGGTSVESCPNGDEIVTFIVWDEQFLKTPAWPQTQESPPLSPRKAEKAATEIFHKLVKERDGWKRDQIILEDMGDGIHWIYIIDFSHHGVYGGSPPSLRVIVLMDGTVPTPSIVKRLF